MTKRFPYIVLAAAFSLAASAAYYSVFGLSKLFASQATAVIILASTLEISTDFFCECAGMMIETSWPCSKNAWAKS